MTDTGSIYIIKNTINSKVYIGQTRVPINIRFSQHLSAARNKGHYTLYKAIRKYGEENFFIELIETCAIDSLNDREEYWISFYNANKSSSGYNMTPGGSRQGDPYNKSQVTDKIILEEFNNGLSAFKIAKKYHTEIARVTLLLKKFNIKYGKDLQILSKSKIDKIIELYLIGYGRDTIAKYLQIHDSTVSKYLKKYHIPTRTTKETKLLGRNLPKLI